MDVAMSYEFFIGRRYLRVKKRHAFISLITILSIAGVTVGVMALIVVIAVMAGFESDLKSRILGVESHLVVSREKPPFRSYMQVAEKIQEIRGVQAVAPFVKGQVMLRSASRVSGAVLKGINPDSAGKVIMHLDADELNPRGREASNASGNQNGNVAPGIILGKELARNLGVLKDDAVYVISPRGLLSPVGPLPSMKRFRVVGFFEVGMYEYDGTLAFVRLSEAQKLMHMTDQVSGIEIRLDDIYLAQRVARQIQDRIGSSYLVRDWRQMNKNLFSALALEKAVMFIILALIILVAAFNIASSLIMMVMEKTKDIAMLKAMGASDRSIKKIFILEGMAIGSLGTILGMSLGLGLCLALQRYKFIELPGDVYYITTLPVRLESLDLLLIAASAFLICFFATLYPAKRAAKLNPVEAIRYG
jgi:lipoprotein-releasing system permease protein